jgi:hypothetical protein
MGTFSLPGPRKPLPKAIAAVEKTTALLAHLNHRREALISGAGRPFLILVVDHVTHSPHNGEAMLLMRIQQLLLEHISTHPHSQLKYITIHPDTVELDWAPPISLESEPAPGAPDLFFVDDPRARKEAVFRPAGPHDSAATGDGGPRLPLRSAWLSAATDSLCWGGVLRVGRKDAIEGQAARRIRAEREAAAAQPRTRQAQLAALLATAADSVEDHHRHTAAAAAGGLAEGSVHVFVYGLRSDEEPVPETDPNLARLRQAPVPVQIHWISLPDGDASSGCSDCSQVSSPPTPDETPSPGHGRSRGSSAAPTLGVGPVLDRLDEQTRARIAARAGGRWFKVERMVRRGKNMGMELLATLSDGHNWPELLGRFEDDLTSPSDAAAPRPCPLLNAPTPRPNTCGFPPENPWAMPKVVEEGMAADKMSDLAVLQQLGTRSAVVRPTCGTRRAALQPYGYRAVRVKKPVGRQKWQRAVLWDEPGFRREGRAGPVDGVWMPEVRLSGYQVGLLVQRLEYVAEEGYEDAGVRQAWEGDGVEVTVRAEDGRIKTAPGRSPRSSPEHAPVAEPTPEPIAPAAPAAKADPEPRYFLRRRPVPRSAPPHTTKSRKRKATGKGKRPSKR